jgi:hypothetical protein
MGVLRKYLEESDICWDSPCGGSKLGVCVCEDAHDARSNESSVFMDDIDATASMRGGLCSWMATRRIHRVRVQKAWIRHLLSQIAHSRRNEFGTYLSPKRQSFWMDRKKMICTLLPCIPPYLCMLPIQHLPPILTKTPGAGAKQEVCHYSMQKRPSGRTFHRYGPPVTHRPVSRNRHDWGY